MVVYDPPTAMELRWGDDTLRFDLEAQPDGTRLTLVAVFDDLGKAARDGAGWHACLDILAYEISGEPLPWAPEHRWSHVHPLYLAAFPPEAATEGPPDWHPES